MSTILGEHISLIRPAKIRVPARQQVWRQPRASKPTQREIGTAEFFRLCLTIDCDKYVGDAELARRSSRCLA